MRAAVTDEERRAIDGVRELVVSTLQDVRRLAVELRPTALDDFGLVPAVERLTETFREQSGLQVELEAQLGEERLAQAAETALYRVIQEAFTNVAKHSGAGRVSVLLQRKDGTALAVIEDDGRGFDPAEVRDDALGLEGMRERLALVGGRLRIETSSGAGTTLVAEVPSA